MPVPAQARKRGPPSGLRIDTPARSTSVVVVQDGLSASSDVATPFSARPRSLRNQKGLSLALPSSTTSSEASLPLPLPRRTSVASLPPAPTAMIHRKDEQQEGSDLPPPYQDGPIEIMPKIWLGSEDNARDWRSLLERGIRSILNVAKEVQSPFVPPMGAQQLRPFASTPNLVEPAAKADPTYMPAHLPSGRPPMYYLKLSWSHGQPDLVNDGFPAGMDFVDRAIKRGDGVLIHSQSTSPDVPEEIRALKGSGMQGAYNYVKEKSPWVGPNMSLIYQLLEYERAVSGPRSRTNSNASSATDEEEERWNALREQLSPSPTGEREKESMDSVNEAKALDRAMEERMHARKISVASSTGIGMGAAWKSRYGSGRNRAESNASSFTTRSSRSSSISMLSENLVEEEEEEGLLATGSSGSVGVSAENEDNIIFRPLPGSSVSAETPTMRWFAGRKPLGLQPPPSAGPTKTSFQIGPPPPRATKPKRRPPPLLPPVPDTPVRAVQVVQSSSTSTTSKSRKRRSAPPPISMPPRSVVLPSKSQTSLLTPSHQTLFVFPPSPTQPAASTMTLTSTQMPATPLVTPRVSTFRSHGRSKSYIGLSIPSTPTTACSRVDARGWVGLGPWNPS